MNKLFKKYKITTFINITITNLKGTIDEAVLEKIKSKYEGKVSKYGYIKNNSIEIIKRSMGTAMKEHFNSSFNFKAVCYALICNPDIDHILEAVIISSNNAGFKAHVVDKDNTIIDIIIPRLTAGIKHEYDIDNLDKNAKIHIKVCRKRLHFNDTKITVIGMIIKDPNLSTDIEGDEDSDKYYKEKQEDDELNDINTDINEEDDDEEDDDDDDDEDDDDKDSDDDVGEDEIEEIEEDGEENDVNSDVDSDKDNLEEGD